MKPLPALFSLLWIFANLGCTDPVLQEEAVSALPVPIVDSPLVQETEVVLEEESPSERHGGGHDEDMSHEEQLVESLKSLAGIDHRFKGMTVEQWEMLGRAFEMVEKRVAGYEEFNERLHRGEGGFAPSGLGLDDDDEDDSMNRMIFFLETMDEEGLTEYLTSVMQDMVDLSLAQ